MNPQSTHLLIASIIVAAVALLSLPITVDAQHPGKKKRGTPEPTTWAPQQEGVIPSDLGQLVSVDTLDRGNYLLAFRSDDGDVHLVRIVNGNPPTKDNYLMKLTRQ